MVNDIRYLVSSTSAGSDLIDLYSPVPDYVLKGQSYAVTGSGKINIVMAAPGATLDARSLLSGTDVIFFEGSWGDYTKDIGTTAGAIIFTRTTADGKETVTVANGSILLTQDRLVFADGSILTHQAKKALAEIGLSVSTAEIQDNWNADQTTVNPGALIPSTFDAVVRGIAGVSTGVRFAMPQIGVKHLLTGGGGADSIYVSAGAEVDARSLLGGMDVIYFTGKWGDYEKDITSIGGAIVFTRTGDAAEKIMVANGAVFLTRDKLVFADGWVRSDNARIALNDDLSVSTANMTGWSTTETTPLPAVTKPVLTLGDGISDGANATEAAATTGAFSVTADSGATVTLSIAGPSGSIAKTVTGAGSGTPVAVVLTADELTALGDGAINIVAFATDANGNKSQTATSGFTLDTVAEDPVITSTLPLGFDVDGTLTISGGAEAGSTGVTVKITDENGNNASKAATVTQNSDGTTSWMVDFSGTDFGAIVDNAIGTVTVTATDAVGNEATVTGDVGPGIDITATALSAVSALDVRGSQLALDFEQAVKFVEDTTERTITLKALAGTTDPTGFDGMAAPSDIVIKIANGAVTSGNGSAVLSTDGKQLLLTLSADLDLNRSYSILVQTGIFTDTATGTDANKTVKSGEITFSTVNPDASGTTALKWDVSSGSYVEDSTWYNGTTGTVSEPGLGGTSGLDVSSVAAVVVVGRDTDSSANGVVLAHGSYSKLTGFGGDDRLYVDVAGGTANSRIDEGMVAVSDTSTATQAITSLDFTTLESGAASVDISFADNSATTSVDESSLVAIALDASADSAVTLGAGEYDFKTLTGNGTPVLSG